MTNPESIRNRKPYPLRLPSDERRQLEALAKQNQRSLNEEINEACAQHLQNQRTGDGRA